MHTKYLCFLIHIRNKGEFGTIKHIKASSNFLTDRSKAVDLFCYLCFMFVFVILSCLFFAAL